MAELLVMTGTANVDSNSSFASRARKLVQDTNSASKSKPLRCLLAKSTMSPGVGSASSAFTVMPIPKAATTPRPGFWIALETDCVRSSTYGVMTAMRDAVSESSVVDTALITPSAGHPASSPSTRQTCKSYSSPKRDPAEVHPNTKTSGITVPRSLAAGFANSRIILSSASRVVSTRYIRSVCTVYLSGGSRL